MKPVRYHSTLGATPHDGVPRARLESRLFVIGSGECTLQSQLPIAACSPYRHASSRPCQQRESDEIEQGYLGGVVPASACRREVPRLCGHIDTISKTSTNQVRHSPQPHAPTGTEAPRDHRPRARFSWLSLIDETSSERERSKRVIESFPNRRSELPRSALTIRRHPLFDEATHGSSWAAPFPLTHSCSAAVW